jgi:hypothetical protein
MKTLRGKAMSFYNFLLSIIRNRCKQLGIREFRQHHLFTPVLQSGAIVVDIGGNLGEFSQQISQNFLAKCYIVEAVPSL